MTISAFDVMSRERRLHSSKFYANERLYNREAANNLQFWRRQHATSRIAKIANPVLTNYNPLNRAAWEGLKPACLHCYLFYS